MKTAVRYHEETKYAPETIDQQPQIDWSTQPRPFKEFRSQQRTALRSHWQVRMPRPGVLEADGLPAEPGKPTLAKLSALLAHTAGVTLVIESGRERTYFRAAPSAGALYPTETYVVVRKMDGIADGIYNYQVREHCLAPLIEGDFSRDLEHWGLKHPAIAESHCIILFSAVFKRSSFRYFDRAYRRILLDTGHMLGNLTAFAPEVGLDAIPLASFHDGGLNSLVLFDEREEGVLAVCPLVENGKAFAPAIPLASGTEKIEPAGSLLLDLHYASAIGDTGARAKGRRSIPATRGASDGRTFDIASGVRDFGDRMSPIILTRRSTRQFSAKPMELEDLAQVLATAYLPTLADHGAAGPRHFFDPGRIETYIAVQRVNGLSPGLYAYEVAKSELRQLQSGDPSRASEFICLGQELGSRAGAVIFHCAALPEVIDAYGDRGYRYLGLDAGHIGQRMAFAAIDRGLGTSGIGGYYDNHVNALFGLPKEMAATYITCIGRPAERQRI